MTPEQVRRISQADIGSSHPGTDNEKGFGLGLQICREFINGNRGTLSVESRVGRGSILRFTLPRTGHPEQTGTSCNPPDESGEALAHSGV